MKQIFFLQGILLYSFYLIGIFFNDVNGLSFIFIAVAIILFLIKTRIDLDRNVLIFIGIFNIVVFFSLAFNINTKYSIYKAQLLFIKFNTLFLIPQLVSNMYIKFFVKGIFQVLIFSVLILLVHTIKSLGSFDFNNRLEIGILNPIWISRLVLEALLLSIILYGKNIKVILILALAILPIIYASGSKGPVFAFLCSLFIFLLNQRKISLKDVRYFFGLLAIIVVTYYGYLGIKEYDNYFTQRFFTIIPEGVDLNAVEENRALFIPVILENFFNHDYTTILFGAGIGNTSYILFGKYSDDRFYPHNLLIEILCEFGLISAITIVVIISFFLIKANGSYKYVLIYFLINSMFSGDIILNEFIFLYAGFVIATNKKLIDKNESYLPNDGKLLQRADY
ncbi:MAG: hypothetical protein ACK4R6_10260 [Spirosomataceae bacterium]